MEAGKPESSSSPAVTIPEVSRTLQLAREAKGVSLREAEVATRVPVYYLQLLEGKGDARILSDALYLVPFLRTYALFLGLDPAETIAQFVQAIYGKEDTVSDFSVPLPSPRSALRPTLLLLVVISAVVFTLLWLLQRDALIPWQ